jgi:hypothetical protein
MKFYGHANLQQNEVQNAALSTLTNFPDAPVVGQLAFVNSIVYICVGAGALPVWVPLTREITSYTHSQGSASATWNITHNLNTTEVNVQVYGTDNKVLMPDEILVQTPTTATIYFNSAVAGKAVVVTGSFEGNPKPAYAFTFNQGSASTTWTIDHNLGYHPIVRVFIGLNEVQPSSIVHDTANRVTVTFTTPQVGYARLL